MSRLCLCLIDHLHHIMIRFGGNADLLDVLCVLFGEHEESQVTDGDLLMPERAFPDRSQFKDQDTAPLGFVLVLRQAWTTRELRRVRFVGVVGLKKGSPGFVELNQDLISDFGRKRFVGISSFEQRIESSIIQVFSLEHKGLANVVIRKIPQVLRCKSHLVDLLELGVGTLHHMLFDAFHACSPSSGSVRILPITSFLRFALLCP